jgi:HSP20 family protein
MAKNTSEQTNDTRSTQSTTSSAKADRTDQGESKSASVSRPEGTSDRERSIEKGREESRGVARRGQSSEVYGPGAGTMTSPFMLMRRMAEDMDRLFENFGFAPMGLTPSFGSRLGRDLWNDNWNTTSTKMWSPQIETFRRGDKLVLRADLPGLKKEDVKVEIENGMLTISGERNEEHEENRDDFYRSERSYGRFYRALPLPDGVGDDQCEASFRDGVLEVSLPAPKQAERKAKQIQIR